jgi:hypothetical protein
VKARAVEVGREGFLRQQKVIMSRADGRPALSRIR